VQIYARNAWQRLGNMTPEVAMEQYITLLSRRIPELMVSLCFWTTYCYCFLSDFFHERIYLLVQGDNKQVSEELEAFRHRHQTNQVL